ncbi:MAG: M20/M25/M40 family metallo-hydrolase [Rhodothermales bacterium]
MTELNHPIDPHTFYEQSDVGKLHAALVATPSLSHEERAAADLLEAHFRESGLDPQRFDDNIVVSVGSGPRTLLLNSHLDVVPPSSDHPFDPFTPTIDGSEVFGRGTVDAKGCVAAMATALVRLNRSGSLPPDARVMGAFTVCEETGGTDNGLEAIRPSLPDFEVALIGEPTHMQPCVAQKGLLILRLDAHGKTSHAARAEEGDNAISRLVRDLSLLADFRFERIHPFLGETTQNVTVIEGGTARNVIPDRCSAWIDIRTTPSYSHPEIAAMLNARLESEVVIHSQRFIPVETPTSHPIIASCLAAHEGAEPFGSPTMSDWLQVHDVPTVKIGPGDSRKSHTAHESIDVFELHQASAIYESIVTHYFKS